MSTLAEIRTNTLVKLAESSGGTWQNSEIDVFVNREYEHLQTLINEKNDEYLAKVQTTSTTTNELYSFPTDMSRLLMIEIQMPNRDRWEEVPKISIHKKEQYSHKFGYWNYAEPSVYYYMLGDQFGLIPVRSSSGLDDLKIWYVYKPIALSADLDIPLIPVLYHELLEIGATNRARRSVKEPPLDEGDYHQKINSMLESISQRVKHRPEQVRIISGLY